MLKIIFRKCAAHRNKQGLTPVWSGFLAEPVMMKNFDVIIRLRKDKRPGDVFDDAETNHALIVGAFRSADTINVSDADFLSWLDDQLDAVQSLKDCGIVVP